MAAVNTKRENRKTWFHRIEQWQRSRLTQADYCRQQHLKPLKFLQLADKTPLAINNCRMMDNTINCGNRHNVVIKELVPLTKWLIRRND